METSEEREEELGPVRKRIGKRLVYSGVVDMCGVGRAGVLTESESYFRQRKEKSLLDGTGNLDYEP